MAIRGKLSRRILPFVCGVFILSFLDRVNLSYAAADMSRDLELGPAMYGLGAGLFFIGYLLLEIPAAKLVAARARFWLSVMMISWGCAAAAMGFVRGAGDFFAWRVVLGIAEAGFFPGIIIYLSRWFLRQERARAISALAIGLPAANLIGDPVSALLLRQNWLHVAGWRWLFLIEGIPSILAGLLTLPTCPTRRVRPPGSQMKNVSGCLIIWRRSVLQPANSLPEIVLRCSRPRWPSFY